MNRRIPPDAFSSYVSLGPSRGYEGTEHASTPPLSPSTACGARLDTARLNRAMFPQPKHLDETDEDPMTAVNTGSSFGSVPQISVSIYDELGRQLDDVVLNESLSYFS